MTMKSVDNFAMIIHKDIIFKSIHFAKSLISTTDHMKETADAYRTLNY